MLKKLTLLLTVLMILAVSGCGAGPKAPPPRGRIYVSSEPSLAATITIDGKKTGKTTNAVLKKIKAGRHKIKLSKVNPNRPDLPFVGAAEVYLRPGQKLRVTIQLNVMAVQPRESTATTVVAQTEGEKTILDFYRAVNNQDYATAYGLISNEYKKYYGYSYRVFRRNWSNVKQAEIKDMRVTKTPTAQDGTEVATIDINITYNPPPAYRRRRRTKQLGGQTNPDQAGVNSWNIITVSGGRETGDLWKINNITAVK